MGPKLFSLVMGFPLVSLPLCLPLCIGVLVSPARHVVALPRAPQCSLFPSSLHFTLKVCGCVPIQGLHALECVFVD